MDVLGHEILYTSLAGSVTGKNPGESSISGFKLNFTPSSRVQKAVDKLKVDKVIIADSGPVIDIIINTFNQNEEHNLLKGKGVRRSIMFLSGVYESLLQFADHICKGQKIF